MWFLLFILPGLNLKQKLLEFTFSRGIANGDQMLYDATFMFFQLQHTKWPGPQCGISAYIHGWTVSQVNLISSCLSQWWKAFDKDINACNLCCFGWLSLLLYLHSSTFETNRCSGDSEDKVNSECPTSPPLSHACDTISEESEETVNTKASTVVHAGNSQVDTGQKVSSSSALFLLKLF